MSKTSIRLSRNVVIFPFCTNQLIDWSQSSLEFLLNFPALLHVCMTSHLVLPLLIFYMIESEEPKLCLYNIMTLNIMSVFVTLSREYWEENWLCLGIANMLFDGNSTWISWWLRWWRIHLQFRRAGFDPWVGKTPWRKEWLTHSSILA